MATRRFFFFSCPINAIGYNRRIGATLTTLYEISCASVRSDYISIARVEEQKLGGKCQYSEQKEVGGVVMLVLVCAAAFFSPLPVAAVEDARAMCFVFVPFSHQLLPVRRLFGISQPNAVDAFDVYNFFQLCRRHE